MKNKYLSTKISGYTGFFVQAVINNFLPILFIALQDVYNLNYARLSILVLFNFGAQIVIDMLAPKILALLGFRKAAFLSQFTAFFGLALLSVLPKIISGKLKNVLFLSTGALMSPQSILQKENILGIAPIINIRRD